MDYKQSQRKWKALQGLSRHMWDINQKNRSNAATYKRMMKFADPVGGQRAPARSNPKNGSWVKAPRPTKADKQLATRGWVKKTLALDHVGKEVTANVAGATAGSLVFFRLGKNIDKGNDQADRKGSVINMLGLRFFGSVQISIPVSSPIRFRYILAQDKTPGRTITEAFFSSTADSRDPIDFPTGATFGTINAIRPINTDRWIVKADWIERLGAGLQTPNYGSSIVFNRYFPINRKFTYNADYLTSAEDLLPCMYMLMFPVTDDGTITQTLDTNYQFEEYFHN